MRQAREIVPAALGVVLAVTVGAPAWAFMCERYVEGQCVEYRMDVPSSSTPGASRAGGASFGAIAYGRKSGAKGYSYRWGSEAKAESVALQNCAQHGSDCEIMVWFDRRCGAVAVADDAAAFWGLGNSDGQARADAQSKCANAGGKDCAVQVLQCSK